MQPTTEIYTPAPSNVGVDTDLTVSPSGAVRLAGAGNTPILLNQHSPITPTNR